VGFCDCAPGGGTARHLRADIPIHRADRTDDARDPAFHDKRPFVQARFVHRTERKSDPRDPAFHDKRPFVQACFVHRADDPIDKDGPVSRDEAPRDEDGPIGDHIDSLGGNGALGRAA